MTEVATPSAGHPGPMSRAQDHRERQDSEDSIERELDWVINRPDTTSEGQAERKVASPRGSPRSPPPPVTDDDDDDDNDDDGRYRRPKSRTGAEEDEDTAPEYADAEYDMSKLSDDQRQAMLELQNMKLDLAYTTDEEPPEYDVTERLRQLNAELAEDPTPVDDPDRQRSITFQEDPVSLVVPPADYSDTDDEPKQPDDESTAMESEPDPVDNTKVDSPNDPNSSTHSDNTYSPDVSSNDGADHLGGGDSGTQQHPGQMEQFHGGSGDHVSIDSEEVGMSGKRQVETDDQIGMGENEHRYGDSHDYEEPVESDNDDVDDDGDKNGHEQTAVTNKESGDKQTKCGDDDDDDEKVLIERNGKFHHISTKDLTAEERELYGVGASKNEEEESKNNDKPLEPRPPSYPRPYTANGGGQRKHGGAPRSSSAIGQQTNDEFNYKSPYAMTPEERRRRAKEKREQEKRQKEEEEARKEQEERDKADAEDAFQAWLNLKKKEAQEKRKEEDETRKKEQGDRKAREDERENDSAFKEWLKVKRTQKKETQETEKKRVQEYDEGYYVRSRSECNKAFKEWLKKKNADLRKAQQEEMAKARVHKLLARKSRKSQQLARAIKQAQAFKYVDYYGYRY